MLTEFERSPYYEARRTLWGMPGLMPEVLRPHDLKLANQKMEERTARFQAGYFANHPETQSDQRVAKLFEDMNNAGFWHVLGRIDGYDPNSFSFARDVNDQDRLKQGIEAREWAQANFTKEELQEMFGIIVDTALRGIHSDTNLPGFKRGHTILYSHLVEKPESMFAEQPTPALIRRLNNGRFWENLPYLKPYGDPMSEEVGDVLFNHVGDLDPDFFEQGYRIFKRNGGEEHALAPYLYPLTEAEVAKYWGFVKELDQRVYDQKETEEDRRISRYPRGRDHYQKPSDTDSRIAFLVRPYLHYAHALIAPTEHRKFDERATEGRFSDPVLQKYLETSDMLREALAGDLQEYLGDASNFVGSILYNIPKPREMVSRLLAKARSLEIEYNARPSKGAQLKGISSVLRVTGIDLKTLLALDDVPLARLVNV